MLYNKRYQKLARIAISAVRPQCTVKIGAQAYNLAFKNLGSLIWIVKTFSKNLR